MTSTPDAPLNAAGLALEHVTELLVDTWSVAMPGDPEAEFAVINARLALTASKEPETGEVKNESDQAGSYQSVEEYNVIAKARAALSHTGKEPVGVKAPPIELGYTNWRGEYAVRRIFPLSVWFGSTEWHPEPQWLLKAVDDEKDAERDFALAGFSALLPQAVPQPLPAGEGEIEAWCQPMDCGKHTPRKFLLRFEDADKGDCVFDDEGEARRFFERANVDWNCYLFGAMPLSLPAPSTGEAVPQEANKPEWLTKTIKRVGEWLADYDNNASHDHEEGDPTDDNLAEFDRDDIRTLLTGYAAPPAKADALDQIALEAAYEAELDYNHNGLKRANIANAIRVYLKALPVAPPAKAAGDEQQVEQVARAVDPTWWTWADVHYDGTIAGDAVQRKNSLDRARRALAALQASTGGAEAFDLQAHLQRQRSWSEKTFGPGPRTKGVVDHIRKELTEIEADPADIAEWIDVTILAFDGAWRADHSPEQIILALVAKQTKNEARNWPDWRTMSPDQAIEHVRAASPDKEGKL